MTLNLTIPEEEQELKPRITVVGVGGAGGNAVNNMIRANLIGCEFVICNTDAQAMNHNLCERRIQMGVGVTRGLGAGSRPEVGRAAAEEALFYPRLLKDDSDAADDTKDAIRDHNEIRDAIRDAEGHRIGEAAWWEAVNATERANTEHMGEEEKGPLMEFDGAASADEQAELASSFAAFETEHAGARGIGIEDRDPEGYVADNS